MHYIYGKSQRNARRDADSYTKPYPFRVLFAFTFLLLLSTQISCDEGLMWFNENEILGGAIMLFNVRTEDGKWA